MNVIHGIGKPRILLSPDTTYFQGAVLEANATSVTLKTVDSSLSDWEGRLIEGTDINGDYVYAVIQSKNGNTFIIDRWFGGDDIDYINAGFPSPVVNNLVRIRGKVIDLPYCNQLTENFTLDTIHRKLFNGSLSIIKRGWWYSATLDYSRFISKETLQSLELAFNIGETFFRFYPRRDNPNVHYKVYFSEDFVLSFYQGRFHKGHKGVIIPLVGYERTTNIDLTSEISYRFLGYGDVYGETEYLGNPEVPYRVSEIDATTGEINKLVDHSGNNFTDGKGNQIKIRTTYEISDSTSS